MWDRIGVSLSGLCLIHCLALPVLFAAMPWVSQRLDDERIHLLFAAAAVPVAVISFVPAFLKHRKRHVLALGLSGALFLLLPVLLGSWIGEAAEHQSTILGGILLVAGHVANLRVKECCSGEPCSPSFG